MVIVGLWVDWMEDIQEVEVVKKEPIFMLFGVIWEKGISGEGRNPGSHPSVETNLVQTPSVELPLLRLVPIGKKRNLKGINKTCIYILQVLYYSNTSPCYVPWRLSVWSRWYWQNRNSEGLYLRACLRVYTCVLLLCAVRVGACIFISFL